MFQKKAIETGDFASLGNSKATLLLLHHSSALWVTYPDSFLGDLLTAILGVKIGVELFF